MLNNSINSVLLGPNSMTDTMMIVKMSSQQNGVIYRYEIVIYTKRKIFTAD